MAELSQLTSDNLDKQGFCDLGEAGKSRYARPLRFTPAVATILVVMGLILQSPIVIGSMALIGLSGVLFPRGMLIDVVYNLGIRHIFNSPRLPPTPTPRRFSYGISTVWLAGSAASFHFGLPLLGILFGVPVAIGGTVLATTLWCLGSWLYRPVGALVAEFEGTRKAGK
ncbi:DUF4395 family protein [Demequina lutea]|uniref:DUF4395 domain-containing protein n=1 Tax=Demequina lutea TaxID=431489 RepID=A0A7Y9ZA55_9MICO|nr:DUF4395 family protein [Demequina lutea]NYI40315.1 hypothetical protein [Demequina lutea]